MQVIDQNESECIKEMNGKERGKKNVFQNSGKKEWLCNGWEGKGFIPSMSQLAGGEVDRTCTLRLLFASR